MKKLSLLLLATCFSAFLFAQGNSQSKTKDKQNNKGKSAQASNKEKEIKERADHDKKIWEGTYINAADAPKPSKNQPAKVRSSFQRDYPNATGVYWSKYRGDWTATFRNGIWTSTAVYHANGDRRDTRTPIRKDDIPKKIFDIIINKPETRVDDAIRIEVPKVIKDIFRIKSIIDGKPQYQYYNSDGIVVQYNY